MGRAPGARARVVQALQDVSQVPWRQLRRNLLSLLRDRQYNRRVSRVRGQTMERRIPRGQSRNRRPRQDAASVLEPESVGPWGGWWRRERALTLGEVFRLQRKAASGFR